MALLLNKRKSKEPLAPILATEVYEKVRRELEETTDQCHLKFWPPAVLGLAELIRGNLKEAESWYSRASGIGKGLFGVISSSRRDARLVGRHLGLNLANVERILHVPNVVVFAGHMIDRNDRRVGQRFPYLSQLENAVRLEIMSRLKDKLDGHIGYSSAACGSDILFLEVLQALGESIGQARESP